MISIILTLRSARINFNFTEITHLRCDNCSSAFFMSADRCANALSCIVFMPHLSNCLYLRCGWRRVCYNSLSLETCFRFINTFIYQLVATTVIPAKNNPKVKLSDVNLGVCLLGLIFALPVSWRETHFHCQAMTWLSASILKPGFGCQSLSTHLISQSLTV